MNGECEWIKVFPLPKDCIFQLENLEVLSEVSAFHLSVAVI